MSGEVSCPFCGVEVDPISAHPFDPVCPLSTYSFAREKWAMRPPKKEQPAQTVVSEIEYLRRLVRGVVTQYICPGTDPEVGK